jgi:hypothetical protein
MAVQLFGQALRPPSLVDRVPGCPCWRSGRHIALRTNLAHHLRVLKRRLLDIVELDDELLHLGRAQPVGIEAVRIFEVDDVSLIGRRTSVVLSARLRSAHAQTWGEHGPVLGGVVSIPSIGLSVSVLGALLVDGPLSVLRLLALLLAVLRLQIGVWIATSMPGALGRDHASVGYGGTGLRDVSDLHLSAGTVAALLDWTILHSSCIWVIAVAINVPLLATRPFDDSFAQTSV